MQTVPPTEVIVIWQGEDTATSEVATQAARELRILIRVVHTPEVGIVPAENTGLQAAAGDIVLLIDDDAEAPPQWLECHLKHYTDASIGAVGGPAVNFAPDGHRYPTRHASVFGKLTWYGKLIGNLFDHETTFGTINVDHLAGGNMSFRRSALRSFERHLKPYWQYFEAEACLQLRRAGYHVLYDSANPIHHYPTNSLFDGMRSGDFDQKFFNAAFNHGFIIGKHSAPLLSVIRLLYLLAIGSIPYPGLVAFPFALRRYGQPLRELRVLLGVMAAHGAGYLAGTRDRRNIEHLRRILIIAKAFTPSVGGVETYTALLAQGLVRAGAAVEVVTNTPAPLPEDRASGFETSRRPGFRKLLRSIRRADLIHLAGPLLVPLLLCFLFRKRCVVEHHGYQAVCVNGLLLKRPGDALCPNHFLRGEYHHCFRCVRQTLGPARALVQLAATVLRRILCRFAKNVAVSRHVRRRLRLDDVAVIYHGVPVAKEPCPYSVHPKLSVSFGYVGRLASEKGIETLLDAAAGLRPTSCDFQIVVVGDGPLRPILEQRADRLGLNASIRFRGTLRGEALAQACANIDAVIMPSTWEETAGLAAIEHMMRGRLVIVSDLGGVAEIVGDAGLTFAPGDASALKNHMQHVLENRALLTEYGTRARVRALSLFREDRMVSDHMTLYRTLTARHG